MADTKEHPEKKPGGEQKKQSGSLENLSAHGVTKWAILLSLVVVVGGVMSYGLVASVFGIIDERTSLSMIFMIFPMLLIMWISLRFVLEKINQRIDKIRTAITEVSGGDLSVQIPEEDAGEYLEVYKGFNAMVRELKRTREEMVQFTNDFTHEFKTPITSIHGFADYLYETGKETEEPERLEYLKVISDQSARLANMATNALILTKAEACQVVTDKMPFNLGEQIRQCAILLLREMEEKDIELELPEEFDFTYNADEEQLQQVWINILKNAVKFTHEGGTISISYEKEINPPDLKAPKAIRVSISDTGIGMDEETKKHIFDKYYQNDSVSLTRGNGIGLAIVKRIVELYEGNIEVKSAPGEGSTFIVSLPDFSD